MCAGLSVCVSNMCVQGALVWVSIKWRIHHLHLCMLIFGGSHYIICPSACEATFVFVCVCIRVCIRRVMHRKIGEREHTNERVICGSGCSSLQLMGLIMV